MLSVIMFRTSFPSLISTGTEADATPLPTVVIDAGHGGEDGGAVSKTGVVEKDLNLSIAMQLCQLLTANGINVVMTRTDDRLLYDRTIDYKGRKKSLDLAARLQIAEKIENCVFVSIHMNAFPQSKATGLQVWYSANNERSKLLAEEIRSTVVERLQPDNYRAIKKSTSSIYLLHHLSIPAVLVECGFLSNPEEAELLASKDYQAQLAFTLFFAVNEAIRKI